MNELISQFAEVNFYNDLSKPISLIDTIGFDDPQNDADSNIISELVMRLQNFCDHINLFIIAVNGQNPRLDGALVGMIRIFEANFFFSILIFCPDSTRVTSCLSLFSFGIHACPAVLICL